MRIRFKLAEQFLNAQLRDLLQHKVLVNKRILLNQTKISELEQLKDQQAFLIKGILKCKYCGPYYTSPVIDVDFVLRIRPILKGGQLSFELLSIDSLTFSGYSKGWKNRILSGIINRSRLLLIRLANKSMIAIDWRQELRKVVAPALESNIRTSTGLHLRELSLQLLSLHKAKEEDLWMELETRAHWAPDKGSLTLEAEFFPDPEMSGAWQILLDDKVLEPVVRQFLTQQDFPTEPKVLQLQLHEKHLLIDFMVEKPIKLQLQWSARVDIEENQVKLRQPKIRALDGKKGWKEKLVLPGLRWMMLRKWSDIPSLTYEVLGEMITRQVVAAMASQEAQWVVSAALEVDEIQWKEDQILVLINGDCSAQIE